MIFRQHASNLNYFLPIDAAKNCKLFVFTNKRISDFSLLDALAGQYSENYLLVFYKNTIDYSDLTRQILLEKMSGSSRIYWLDDFDSETVSAASYIYLRQSEVLGFSNLGIGGNDPNIQLLHRGVRGEIRLDASQTCLTIEPPVGRNFEFIAHGVESRVGLIIISLTNATIKIGKYVMAARHSVGAVNFQLLRKKGEEMLQPVSPYFIDQDNTPSPRSVKVHYFDKDSYNQNADVFVSLKPFKIVSNFVDLFSSYAEVAFRGDTLTNFSDENGRQFCIRRNGKTLCRVASLEYNAYDSASKRFFLIPEDGETLSLYSESGDTQQLLAGFSGTEAFAQERGMSGIRLTFRETNKVSINKAEGDLDERGDSKTSLLEVGKREYCLDSERAPIFLNNAPETAYTFVNRANLIAPISLPIIPTFTFRDDTDFGELEEVFRKVRLKKVIANAKGKKLLSPTGSYITPQGFLRQGSSYDLIKNEAKNRFDKTTRSLGTFQFTISDNREDLDASIRKDEVFFVMTPGLYKEYNGAELKAHFAVNTSSKLDEVFQVDITPFYNRATPNEHNNSIIIFKFHKRPLMELLKDTTKWSNNGDILGNQKSLKEVLRQISDGNLLDIDDPYFNDRIFSDPNWNGVLILNVPIGSTKNLPGIFGGLSSSQRLNKSDNNQKIALTTEMNFKYVAFPVNKTKISSSKVSISSTSFYGMIDYNPFEHDADYKKVSKYLDNTAWKFVLSKLKVRFFNSKISFFEAFSFLQVHQLFEDSVKFDPFVLSHGDDGRNDKKPNLIRLEGSYQKNGDNTGQFLFNAELSSSINFGADAILKAITVNRIGFSYDAGAQDFRFDIDASAKLSDWKTPELISIKSIDFSNIGLRFKVDDVKLPVVSFDLSKLFVLPQIDFDCEGLLSSFPIRFSHFKGFKLTHDNAGKFSIDYDFFTLPGFRRPNIPAGITSFFSFIFDFDLGTLGNLAALKALKGQLLFGWSTGGGFAMGLKISGPSTSGFHIDLFGALKLDIEKADFCQINKQFMLRLVNARLSVLGMEMPSKYNVFSALIFAGKGSKVAWLLSYTTGSDDDVTRNKLTLGIGQRVGIPDLFGITSVDQAITSMKRVFDPKQDACKTKRFPETVYSPERNWLVGSENIVSDSWKDVLDLKFVFNDPVLYGVFLRIVGLLDVEIMYKKVSDDLGVWSQELAPDPAIRNIDMGGAAVTLPVLDVDLYTNGDWRGDIGYPRSTDDWARSCLIQIRPFVGWAGFYITSLRNASFSLFAQYLHLLPKDPNNPSSKPGEGCNIIQAGFAFRIGIGAYIDKGIFYVGASISVYGLMEGAFAFNKGQRSIKKLFPDHFALRGRVGAIAELVGYVDFKIIKAAIHVILRVEFGLLLALINSKLQPVPIYIEGSVKVNVSVTICCFRIFRKRICIVIHLSFQATVRFPYTLGGGNQGLLASKANVAKLVHGPINVSFGNVPVVYIPAIVQTGEKGNMLVHQLAINFFGCAFNGGKLQFSRTNVLKDQIIRPIITAVLNTGLKTYSELREVFLEGANGNNTPFIVNSFTPVIFTGYNDLGDRAFLRDNFLFSETEIDSYIALNTTANCEAGGKECPFRMVPVPMTSSLKVVGTGGTIFTTDRTGFTISLSGLFVDAAGSTDVSTHVRREEMYTDAQIEEINQHFDGYVTQFIDRSKTKKIAATSLKDIREDFILPEYFKLIGLLSIEAFYSFLCAKPENRNRPDFDPEIKLAELFSDTGEWIFNDHLESLIGQLNYFYNNGLRLPDVITGNQTKAYYEALNLTNRIDKILPRPDIATADIKLTKAGTTISVSLKNDLFTDQAGLDEFADAGRKSLSTDFDKLIEEFTSVQKTSPFELPKVELGVANSITNTHEGGVLTRFFDVPIKIAQYFKKDRVALDLSVINNGDNSSAPLSFTPCIQIAAKVKPHIVNGETRVAELINVYADDLILMHKVMESGLRFERVTIYLKSEKDNIVQLLPLIKAGEEGKTLLIRANLSPKTHPPVILDRPITARLVEDESYVASLAEQKTFIKLLWQALTTNNSGYHLVESPDSVLFAQMAGAVGGRTVLEYTLIFSFESEADKPFSGIHNYLKVANSADLFKDLDKYTCSLSVKVMQLLSEDGGTKALEPLREYHPKLPAHCFGFSIERSTPDVVAGHDKYLPVEFEIVNNTDINKDKILPLMPLEQNSDANDIQTAGKLTYSHVSPLHKVSDVANIDRYRNVGKNFKLKFSVRDTFGFRAVDLKQLLDYNHVYFDKLIPMTSWPVVACSYWFHEFKNNELVFELKLTAFPKGQEIADEDKSEILNTLHTIIAQLTDGRVTVKLNYAIQTDLKSLLLSFLTYAVANIDTPKEKESTGIYFNIAGDDDFTKILAPEITISRPTDDKLFVELPATVWDKALLRNTTYNVVATNPKEGVDRNQTSTPVLQKETIRPLNDAISSGMSPYCLGLGNDVGGAKVLFLVRKDYLNAIGMPSSPLPRKNYFGITPYSNQLYAGKYTPTMQGAHEYSFVDIDLDVALSKVLTKIDNLLSPTRIGTLGLQSITEPAYVQKLVTAKKALVESELNERTDNIDKKVSSVQQGKIRDEFRFLLLERLENFYAYDGIISLQAFVPDDIKSKLSGYRFTVGVQKDKKYNIVSSKLDFDLPQPNWAILFDQVEPSENIDIEFAPEITHIETDIQPMIEDIEKSTWIQLVVPVKLNSIISTKHANPDEQWPTIRRVFPPKPIIIEHKTAQLPRSGKLTWTSTPDLGKWHYFLKLADPYEANDELDLNLRIRDNGVLRTVANIRNFKGFIAYWSSRFDAEGYLDTDFIDDFAHQMKLSKPSSRVKTIAEKAYRFRLLKSSSGWIAKPVSVIPFNIKLVQEPGSINIILDGDGFDVFQITNRITAVKPEIKAVRNRRAENDAFIYVTDTVTPSMWACLHIQIDAPIRMDDGLKLQTVFDTIETLNLPYKSTVKFLINTTDLDKYREAGIPVVLIRQMELAKGAKPSISPVDKLFDGIYKNGFPALALTVYNDESNENDLPLFTAATIFKTSPKIKKARVNKVDALNPLNAQQNIKPKNTT
ncbi:hypothetical protein [Dyadobacter sp. BHUBP1]|uniref:hypothetical protein n=1 Tax=Dyadobacter sp. BHUBP1 TaxID=3424178 RepID=UPI003D34B06E